MRLATCLNLFVVARSAHRSWIEDVQVLAAELRNRWLLTVLYQMRFVSQLFFSEVTSTYGRLNLGTQFAWRFQIIDSIVFLTCLTLSKRFGTLSQRAWILRAIHSGLLGMACKYLESKIYTHIEIVVMFVAVTSHLFMISFVLYTSCQTLVCLKPRFMQKILTM